MMSVCRMRVMGVEFRQGDGRGVEFPFQGGHKKAEAVGLRLGENVNSGGAGD